MANPSVSKNVAIIGGGIAGLAAAHRLSELAPQCRITLFEASGRLGGVLSTVHEDGFQVEQSADNFITTVPWAVNLCERLGLLDQLVQTNPAYRRTFVVHRGRLHRLPDGFLMMAPTQMWPLAVTPILSPLGKLRAAAEYFIPPRNDDADESMASFVRRRLGREAFDRLVEPLVSAVYAADLEQLSLLATLSRFRDMERDFGSLIRAMRHQMKNRPRHKGESGARYSMFVTLRDGLSSLVDALASRLPAGAVQLNAPVTRIERLPNGTWKVETDSEERGEVIGESEQQAASGQWPVAMTGEGENGKGDTCESPPSALFNPQSEIHNPKYSCAASPASLPPSAFDAIVLAAPSPVTAQLLASTDSALAADLASITHSGTAILSLGFHNEQIGHPMDGMGAVIPAVEHSPILAISFSSRKYTHRVPEGKSLLRAFVGGAKRPDLAALGDDELRPLVMGELARLLRITGDPCFINIARWPNTMPQYHVRHKELVARIEERAAKLPGLQLAGNAYRGVGIPDCIHSGELAAERVVEGLGLVVSGEW